MVSPYSSETLVKLGPRVEVPRVPQWKVPAQAILQQPSTLCLGHWVLWNPMVLEAPDCHACGGAFLPQFIMSQAESPVCSGSQFRALDSMELIPELTNVVA